MAFGAPGSARSVWVAPTRMSSSKRRRRFRHLTSSPVRRCCCCRLEPPRPCSSHAPPWPPNCPAQTRSSLPDVAYTLARRRKENIRMAAVVNDQQDAAAVLGAAEHDNVFVGESVHDRRTEARSESFSSFRARVLSTSGWRVAFTSPSQCSPSTSISAPQGFAEELGIDLRAEVFDGDRTEPGAHRPGPTRAVHRGIRAGEVDRVLRCSPGGVGRTQHRRVCRGHHRGRLRPRRRRSRRCRCAHA